MDENAVIEWLNDFSESVREQDYLRGKSLFSDRVISFGSWTGAMSGIEELYEKQWSNVWPQTTDFEFNLEKANFLFDQSSSPSQCAVTSLWSSQGTKNNETFSRTGRCTIILSKDGDAWKAVHTHFSLTPNGEL
jgi:hypothetical protein